MSVKFTALANDVIGFLRVARVTKEQIRLKFVNLGDFGGSDPVTDSWVLEIAGPYEAMQTLTPTLKKFKFRWSPHSKSWRLDATQYAYSNRKRDNLWNAARRNQQTAYPIIKKMVDEYNRAPADSGSGPTVQDLVKKLRHTDRQRNRLNEAGLDFYFQWPDKYSVDEAKVWVFGNTYPVKDVMKAAGFRWGNGPKGKGWWMATTEFTEVGDQWANSIIRQMPVSKGVPAQGSKPFTDMSRGELLKFIKKHGLVDQDMELNEWYDGEVSNQQVARQLLTSLPKGDARLQKAIFDSGKLMKDHRRGIAW